MSKPEIEKGSFYSQLVEKTALQIISNILTKYGFEVEFLITKDLSNRKSFGVGVDQSLMRDKNFLNEVIALNTTGIKEKFRDRVEKTVVCLYNVGAMNIPPERGNHLTQKRVEQNLDMNTKYLVGYKYVKLTDSIPTPVSGLIPDYTDIFPDGQELKTYTLPPMPSGSTIESYKDLSLETQGYTLMDVLKDAVIVAFEVEMNILTVSEKVLHLIQFILLRELYTLASDSVQSLAIEYTFPNIPQSIIREATYSVSTVGGMDSLGETKGDGLFAVGVTFSDIRAELFSDYSLLRVHDVSDDFPVSPILKVGLRNR